MNYDDAINALKTLLEGTYNKADLLNLARVGQWYAPYGLLIQARSGSC